MGVVADGWERRMLSSPQFRYRRLIEYCRLAACFTLLAALLTQNAADAQTMRPPRAAALPAFGNKQFHLASTPAQRVVAILSDNYEIPNLQARQWLIYAPDAPDTDDQTAVFSTLTIGNAQGRATTWSALSPDSRKLLTARLLDGYGSVTGFDSSADRRSSQSARLATTVTYTALLFQRKLVPGPPTSAPTPMSAEERDLYTQPSETIDYSTPVFQAWLNQNRLRRSPGERDLDFALRVFRRIRTAYRYRYDLAQDRRASSICQCSATDCGGLSQLFVATLRAGDIPAVALCGRIARSAEAESSEAAPSLSLGNVHVKSQFYASGIGWVPVEMSGAVYDRMAPEREYFGRTSGDFLTLSVGNDLQLSLGNGTVVSQRGLQGVRFWVWGTPVSEDATKTASTPSMHATTSWSVRQLPISTLGTQIAEAYR